MKYLVRTNELKEKVLYLEKQLDMLNEKIDYLNKVKSDIIWEGIARDKFIKKYDEYLNELNKISNNILNCIKFLSSYDSFDNEYTRLKNKYANIQNRRIN